VNQVERWFAGITDQRIRRGSFTSAKSHQRQKPGKGKSKAVRLDR
jgi:hypothetical protein